MEGGIFMNRHAVQLITRAAINKIGNMLYDYGNSIWLASLGALGQTVLGIYQISELVTSILFNPLSFVSLVTTLFSFICTSPQNSTKKIKQYNQ